MTLGRLLGGESLWVFPGDELTDTVTPIQCVLRIYTRGIVVSALCGYRCFFPRSKRAGQPQKAPTSAFVFFAFFPLSEDSRLEAERCGQQLPGDAAQRGYRAPDEGVAAAYHASRRRGEAEGGDTSETLLARAVSRR